jgi:acetyl esterase/lipase/peptidoglycan/xylan/chitin deacetylase (PgdA/CDA1 family)
MRRRRNVQSSSFSNFSPYLYVSLAALLIFGFAPASSVVLQAQTDPRPKEVAVTIDDLPLNGPQFDAGRLRAMTDKILAAINKHQIPVVGFVNESLLQVPGETDARIAILKAWSDGGVELGNHTFSHLGFKDTTLADYEDDFVRGEAVTRTLLKQKGQKVRYFRHPFLQMGATREIEQSFESFIAERGYKIAPVTVDDMDWMILSAYAGARTQGDAEMMKRVSEEYVKFAGRRFDFSEQAAGDLFGRPIKHILLLHANELVADNLDGLATMLENKGYRFITLEQALKDPVYQAPDKYKDTSDWLSHWAFSKGKKFTPPAPPDFLQKPYLDNQKRATPSPQSSNSAQSPRPEKWPEKWVDYASADYDILPNVTYSIANNTELKLDLYLPKDRGAPNPTLVLFHGGGWVDGQKERNVFQLLPYLSLGWAVINVEYRLARNTPAPAAVEDCRCALRWLAYHAREHNLDTSKIVLTGTSAGGHLSLITGMLPPQSVFDRRCPTDGDTRWREGTEPKINVAAIINWYGITDVAELIDGPNAKHYAMEWFGSMGNREELARQLSPINYVRAGLPPILTFHGDQDDIVPYNQAVRLHAALDKAGAPNQLVTLPGRKHGGFNRQDLVNNYAVIREFLRKHNLLNPEKP